MYIQDPLIKPDSMESREYQINIANSCKERSTLVVLPTGMGKTICALLVIADRIKRFPKEKILFLAPTKPLVEQHKAFLEEYLEINNENITLFTGEVNPNKRQELFENSQVIISTPQVIENDLLNEKLSLENVSLIIFDESHRAVGNYAYVFVALKYKEQGKNQLVMGITASPGSKTKKIMEVCENLNISNIEIRSEYDPDVLPYVHDIDIKWVRVEVPDKVKMVIKQLKTIIEDKCKVLYKFGLIRRFRNVSTTELLEAQKKIQARMISGKKQPHSLYFAATVQAAAIKINHAIELAETQGPSALRNYLERLEAQANTKGGSRAAKSLLKDKNLQRVIKLADNIEFEHPKLQAVAIVVQKQLAAKNDSRIIVFTHYRDTSELVAAELAKIPHARPVRFVGQATHGTDKGLRQKEQVALIEKFKAGENNILVATSVAEEGLDIPATDLVVFYEPIPSEIRTIQRRGRTGRKRAGAVVILITKNTRDEAYYWTSRSKEKRMKHELELLRSKLAEKITVGIPKISHDLEFNWATEIGKDNDNNINNNKANIDENKSVSMNPELNFEPHSEIIITNNSINEQIPIAPSINNKLKTESKGQTNLGDFQFQVQRPTITQPREQSNTKIKVIVDHREFNSTVVRELVDHGVIIESRQLPIGDYIISERICVERKLVNDFLQSLIDGRLFTQLKAVKSAFLKPLLLLEGEGLLTSRKINSSAIYGALVSIIADFNIPVITTEDSKNTAEIIRALALREQLNNKSIPSLRGDKPAFTINERQQFIIEGLPGISATLAQRLLEHFGTVKAIINASVDELSNVKGIGKKTAEEIKNVIEESYIKK